jgi:hypothetical protein
MSQVRCAACEGVGWGIRALAFAGVTFALFAVPSATAQPVAASFTEMSVRPGDDVVATRRSGETVRGRLTEVSGSILRLADSGRTVEVAQADTLRVDRLGDPMWKGLAIGSVIGGGLGVAVVAACGGWCPGAGTKASVVLVPAGIGAGIGALVDLAIPGRTCVFEAPRSGTRMLRLTPFVTSHRGALQATVSV